MESNAHLGNGKVTQVLSRKNFLGPCRVPFFFFLSFRGGLGVLFTFCRWLEVLEFNRQSVGGGGGGVQSLKQASGSPCFIVEAASALNSSLGGPEAGGHQTL